MNNMTKTLQDSPGALLVLGGRSDIGQELSRLLCSERPVVLAARGNHNLQEFEAELLGLGATQVHFVDFEANNCSSHKKVVERARHLAGELAVAVVAFGILGEQHRAERDSAHAVEIAHLDYVAQISMLTELENQMTSGHIVAFSSIAGWRARRANYVYGSTKAGLDAFCQGFSDKLQGSSTALITARPGFVIGSMTEGMKPAPLSVYPQDVAKAIAGEIKDQISRRKMKSRTLWIPRKLGLLALIMRLVPRPLWRKMPR